MPNTFNLEKIVGKKIEGVRVTPISIKIILLFVVFLLLSNFISNFINLTLNRSEQIKLTTNWLIRDLKDIYTFAADQYKMFKETGKDRDLYLEQIAEKSEFQFKESDQKKKSLAIGLSDDGTVLFQAGPGSDIRQFGNDAVLKKIQEQIGAGQEDGVIEFSWNGEKYFGIYRYSQNWQALMIRAEEWNEFYEPSLRTFAAVSVWILVLTVISVIIGVILIRHILRFVGRITDGIMAMQQHQSMDMIDMKGAPSDEVSYLGIAMNSLSNTIQNLLNIFTKFVARDIAQKAYREREIRLEGSKKELSILFTDIKSFTNMTETLGNDIITLINLHYNRAIRSIHAENGDIGSIIGDALLAIFGTMTGKLANKSLQAILAGYEILAETDKLRNEMEKRKVELLKLHGSLSPAEERIYQAVLLEVGVGIDGGEVFYGNIGSSERMVNTVIGDNVNSASRLEGLTRVYRVPMIVSDYVRDEVLKDNQEYYFLELDQVQVKGKTIGKRVYYPIPRRLLTEERLRECDRYVDALNAYYAGNWDAARQVFGTLHLPPAQIFLERTEGRSPPKDWNGIWTMKEK